MADWSPPVSDVYAPTQSATSQWSPPPTDNFNPNQQNDSDLVSTGKAIGAVGENAMAMGSGFIANAIGDAAGLTRRTLDWAQGQNTTNPQDIAHNIKDTLTYKPQTEEGQQLQQGITNIWNATGIPDIASAVGEGIGKLVKGKAGSLADNPIVPEVATDVANAVIPAGIVEGAGLLPKPGIATKSILTGVRNELSSDVWRDSEGNKVNAPDLTQHLALNNGKGSYASAQNILYDKGVPNYYGSNGDPITGIASNGTPLQGESGNWSRSQEISPAKVVGGVVAIPLAAHLGPMAEVALGAFEGPRLFEGVKEAYNIAAAKANRAAVREVKANPQLASPDIIPPWKTDPFIPDNPTQQSNYLGSSPLSSTKNWTNKMVIANHYQQSPIPGPGQWHSASHIPDNVQKENFLNTGSVFGNR